MHHNHPISSLHVGASLVTPATLPPIKSSENQEAVFNEVAISKPAGLDQEPSIAIVGFPNLRTAKIAEVFLKNGWDVLAEANVHKALEFISKTRIDMIVLNLDNSSVLAPNVQRRFRTPECACASSRIMAIGHRIKPTTMKRYTFKGIDEVIIADV